MSARSKLRDFLVSARRNLLRESLVLIVMFTWFATAKAGTRPDYFSARSFGAELQGDFQVRRSTAIVERLNGEAMRVRVFGPFGKEALADERGVEMWNKFSLPGLVRDLGTYDVGFTFVVNRVLVVDASRFLECLLISEQNHIVFLLLRLTQSDDGKIRIADMQFSGSELEVSRSIRQTLILLGYRTDQLLEPEEEGLSRAISKHSMNAAEIFTAINEKDYGLAFGFLQSNYGELNHTRIWRELRNRLAFLGSKSAMRNLEAECASGEPTNSLLSFGILSNKGDKQRALAALEQTIRDFHQPAVLCAIRAGLLIDLNRNEEALASAENLSELNPLSGSSWRVAILAAVNLQKPASAIRALNGWAKIAPRSEIDAILQHEPALTKFLASPDYLAWKEVRKSTALL
ncbi:MAG: hypothetical protein ABIZ04_09555 [Opitutus sp.]